MNIDFESYNQNLMGQEYEAHWLTNSNGVKALVSNLGARLVSFICPDKNGNFEDIVLGYKTMKEHLSGHPYFGSTVGRYANRIAKGKFELDGISYELRQNNFPNHLHGGPSGFNNKRWNVERVEEMKIIMSFKSPDGHEGYPGNLQTTVTYELTEDNKLIVSYEAETDKPTIVNLTNHSYFNLKGEGNGDILDHYIRIYADYITPVNKNLIPTGQLRNVGASAFDFSEFDQIESRIKIPDEQLEYGNGFDINFMLRSYKMDLAADVYEKESGRGLRVYTSQPGVQFYTGNFLDGTDIGKSGKRYYKNSGFCLETQHFPDSINHEDFPSVVLRPGEKYQEQAIYELYIFE